MSDAIPTPVEPTSTPEPPVEAPVSETPTPEPIAMDPVDSDSIGGGDSEPSDHWSSMISDPSIRNSQFIKNLKSVDDLAREATTMLPLIGAEKLPKPPADPSKWTDAQWDMHYNALGRPETVDGYELTDLELPSDMPWDPELEKSLMGAIHKLGGSQRLADGVRQVYGEAARKAYDASVEQADRSGKEAAATLRAEWGDDYEANVEAGRTAIQAALGGSLEARQEFSALRMLDGTFLGDNIDYLRIAAVFGTRMGEDGTTRKVTGNSGRSMTPAAAQDAIDEHNYEYSKAIYDASHPQHKWAIAEQTRLYQARYPEDQEHRSQEIEVTVPIA